MCNVCEKRTPNKPQPPTWDNCVMCKKPTCKPHGKFIRVDKVACLLCYERRQRG